MADIVLKDRNGNDVTYEGIKTVTFDTPVEGVQSTFTEGIAVEGLEIVPDFSGGDMPVTAAENTLVKSAVIKKPEDLAPENIRSGKEIGGVSGSFIGDTEAIVVGESEGATPMNFAEDDSQVINPSDEDKVFSQVTIEKPANLLPENIAEGINIAGILGTFAGGGGGAYGHGTFKASGTTNTLTHNLGCAPDFFVIFIRSGFTSPTAGAAIVATGVSARFAAALGMTDDYQWARYYNSSSASTKSSTTSQDYTIETTQASAIFREATETTVKLGSSSNGALQSGGTYEWYAFGGLT